jgi:hypothetical protein
MINRASLQRIPLEVFESFKLEVGTPENSEADSLSGIWVKVFDKYDKFELRSGGDQDPRSLALLFEEYFVNGLSDGACAGKSMGEFSSRYKYTTREKGRLGSLYLHLNPGVERSYSRFGGKFKANDEQLLSIVQKLSSLPLSHLLFSGQPWRYNLYGSSYLLEATDHYYFYDIINRYMRGKVLRPVFIGDGSGILSNMMLSLECDIRDAVFIDLQHFLTRQYIVNFEHKRKINSYIFAQDFNVGLVEHGDLTIINQDSFPEIPAQSLQAYFSLIKEGKVSRVFSYNHLDLRSHVDYRSMLIEYFGEPVVRFESILRSGYYVEIFDRHGS